MTVVDTSDLTRAKYRFEFMMLMLTTGRIEEAAASYQTGIEILAGLIGDPVESGVGT